MAKSKQDSETKAETKAETKRPNLQPVSNQEYRRALAEIAADKDARRRAAAAARR